MAVRDTPKPRRYYVLNETVPFEEDYTHEFKGHRNLCEEEIPHWAYLSENKERRSRAPVSRAINGFLNTGKGGVVYLGIIDTGAVKAFKLTQFEKDHIVVSLDDLMSRYIPPVEEHRYSIKFVPAVEEDVSDEVLAKITNFNSKKYVDEERRKRPHVLRTPSYCWCTKDAVAMVNNGMHAANYVVEIALKPWDPTDPRNKYPVGAMKTHPIHEDELGRVYVRNQASTSLCTPQDVAIQSKKVVEDHYQPVIDRLKSELFSLRESAATGKI